MTVLLCDLVDSTSLAARLDPEDLHEIISAYHRLTAEKISEFGGFVANYTGDGALACFGYPCAHEDDAERAVRAGLAIVHAMAGVREPEPLRVRVGIATGVVVIGDPIEEGGVRSRPVIGEATNLAARLQSLTAPGTVAIAATTRRLLGGLFECDDLGEVDAKGFAAPVRAWRVVCERPTENRFEALRCLPLAPLVGRQDEIDLILRLWSRATRGEGQVLQLVGEAGIGKSRLVAAALDRIPRDAATRLRYFCSPYRTDSALHPFLAELERSAGFGRDDSPAAKLEKLQTAVPLPVGAQDEFRLLAEFLSIPQGDRLTYVDLAPLKKKERTLAALLARVACAARRGPLIVVFEDAHWIDPTSLELLAGIVGKISSWPALLIVTSRPEFVPPWKGEPGVANVNVTRFNAREAAALVERVADARNLSPELVAQIVERTDGIPLFIEELTKAIVEGGGLSPAGTGGQQGPAPARTIPSTLQASLQARLDLLEAAKEVAQLGAAIGREFSFELVAKLADASSEELALALDRLEAAQLIYRQGSPPSASYVFKHALVQEAAHDSLLRSARRALHARIGELLEREYPEMASAHPEVLARHFAEAGLPAKAAAFWANAGRLAIQRSANREALSHFQRGLDAAAALGPDAERTGLELDLQIGLASASIAARGYAADETERACVRARDLVRSIGDDARQYAVFYGLFVVRWNRAELRSAVEVARELLERALQARARDSAPECVARRALSVAYNAMGEFVAAREQASKAALLYDEAAHRRSAIAYGHDIGVAALMHRAVANLFLGDFGAARATAREAASLARALGHANTIGYAEMWSSFMRLSARQMAAAQRSTERLLRIGEEGGMPQWAAFGRCLRGGVEAIAGSDLAGAVALLECGIGDCENRRIRILRPVFLCLRAEGLGRLGRFDEALSSIDEATATAEQTGERWWNAEFLRVRARLLLSRHGAAATRAEDDLAAAIAVADRQQARMLQLRAATCLARFWCSRGKRKEAADLLTPIYGWFDPGSETPDLNEAALLLREADAA